MCKFAHVLRLPQEDIVWPQEDSGNIIKIDYLFRFLKYAYDLTFLTIQTIFRFFIDNEWLRFNIMCTYQEFLSQIILHKYYNNLSW